MNNGKSGSSGILHRVAARKGAAVTIFLDGVAFHAQEGDSLLCAIATASEKLRVHEFDGKPRAGFCGMGVCQDCWIWVEGQQRVRACSTQVSDGLRLTTSQPAFPGMHLPTISEAGR